MMVSSYARLSILVVGLSSVVAKRATSAAELSAESQGAWCSDCDKFPSAPDYEDSWNQNLGSAFEGFQEKLDRLNQSGVPAEEKVAQVQEILAIAAHSVFHGMQGQGCKSTCAVCLPSPDEMQKVTQGQALKMRSVRVERSKGVQDKALWAATGPVDIVAGALVGSVAAVLPAFGVGIVGGAVTGGIAGSAVGKAVGNYSSLAGSILGLSTGLATGVVSAAGAMAAIEMAGILIGALKGVHLTAALTDCERVGFRRSLDGKWMDKGDDWHQPFTDLPPLGKYGLKRLREWMVKNEDQSNILNEEIFPHDNQSIQHCERLRKHGFDMRHLLECVRHSQLCGSSGAVIVPLGFRQTCRSLSSVDVLEQMAVRAGDDPENGFFAQWKSMQSETSDLRSKCIQVLCEHGGFRKASLKFHPDKVQRMQISDEEKDQLQSTMQFLTQCKSDFEEDGGEPLMLSSKAARDAHCAPPME